MNMKKHRLRSPRGKHEYLPLSMTIGIITEYTMFHKMRELDERVVKRMSEIHRPVLDRIMVLFTYAGTGGFICDPLFDHTPLS